MDTPLHPPASWFEHPGSIPTDRRVTVEPTGRVFGYVKLHGACHTGAAGCKTAPNVSRSNFGLAHQGRTLVAEGHEIETAILAGGTKRHADLGITDPVAAAMHYQEGTENQLARVRYGTDENGTWFSGALWPDADELTVARMLATPNSGDWRYVRFEREHDLAGAVLVNIPGFAMANAGEGAFSAGQMRAIAASVGMMDADRSVELTGDGNIVIGIKELTPVTTPTKESTMCQSCNCNNDPVTAAANNSCTCELNKPTCDCGGKNKKSYAPVVAALIAAAGDGTEGAPVTFEEAVVMKLDEFSAHLAAIDEVVGTLAASRMAESLMA